MVRFADYVQLTRDVEWHFNLPKDFLVSIFDNPGFIFLRLDLSRQATVKVKKEPDFDFGVLLPADDTLWCLKCWNLSIEMHKILFDFNHILGCSVVKIGLDMT